MKSLFLATTMLCLVSSAAVAGRIKADQITSSAKTVNGQIQIHGNFGSGWNAAEVQKFIGFECTDRGKKVTAFQLGETTKRRGTSFVMVCSK